jgi:hypothetical protein
MNLQLSRTDRIVIFGSTAVMMLAGVLYGFWPLIDAHRDMRKFCTSLAPGQPINAVQARAEGLGYEVDKSVPGSVRLVDARSVGTLACLLSVDSQQRISAQPALQD